MTEKKTPKETCKNLKLRLNTNTLRGSGRGLCGNDRVGRSSRLVVATSQGKFNQGDLWKY